MMLVMAALKLSAVLALTLAAAAVFRHRSAAWRHWILAAGIAAALLLPALSVVVPAWEVVSTAQPVSPGGPAITVATVIEDVTVAPPTTPNRWPGAEVLLFRIWAAGTLLGLGSLAAGLWRLSRIARRSRPIDGEWARQAADVALSLGLRRRVIFRETMEPALLVTWGAGRPAVLLPAGAATWSADRIRIVAAHELAHVRRGDWPIQLLGELLRVVYWFHPLAWLACRRLRHESECACDDVVLDLGIPRTAYAAQLLDLARRFSAYSPRWLPAPAIASPSTLQRRIRAMLNVHLDRRPLSSLARLGAVTSMLLASAAIAAIGAQAGATVSGTVTDPTGRGVGGVTLTLSNPTLGVVVSAKTNEAGAFDVPVVAGSYVLEARQPGFATQSVPVTLAGGDRAQRTVVLAVGSLQETITVRSGPADYSAPSRRSAPPAPPKACTPSAAGGRIVPPMKTTNVNPIYPADFPAGAAAQTVRLEARIEADGSVGEAHVIGQVPPALEASAVAAVRQWEFTPALLNCEPIAVTMFVNVTFQPAQ